MREEQKSVPKWILIVSALFALLELIGFTTLIFMPESLDSVDQKARGVGFLIQIWAARQFALAFIFAFATFKKSASMLTISYIFLVVMLIGDIIIGILQKESSFFIPAAVVAIFGSSMLYFVNKQPK